VVKTSTLLRLYPLQTLDVREGHVVLDMMSLDDTIEQKAEKNDVVLR
jgi:hypothetical protein